MRPVCLSRADNNYGMYPRLLESSTQESKALAQAYSNIDKSQSKKTVMVFLD